MTIDCHSALDLLGQKYISAIFCYDAYVFPHTLNFSITCSQTKVLFISQHYKPFVWIFMLTFTYINQTLLKTLFSSCKSTAGMTVIPALPSISHDIETRLPYGKGGGRIFACRSKIQHLFL